MALLTLAAVALSLALVALLGATHNAQATTRAHVRQAVVHHSASADASAATAESPAGESDAPGGPDVQSGNQSGPDTPDSADTASQSSEGEVSAPEADAPCGADTGGNCTGNCVQ
jgi:hypothetical protein